MMRAYRVVIKGLHHTADRAEIQEELEKLTHKVRDLHNPIGRKTKEPLGIFFANFEPASNNKEVFQMRILCRSPSSLRSNSITCRNASDVKALDTPSATAFSNTAA